MSDGTRRIENDIRQVGMEARGIDAWTAWCYGDRLDVRDNLNRPVSARAIERQVKAGMSRVADQAAALSRLPRAQSVLPLLDRILDAFLIVHRMPFRLPWENVQLLPWTLKTQLLWMVIFIVSCWTASAAGFLCWARSRCGLPAPNRYSLPLRC